MKTSLIDAFFFHSRHSSTNSTGPVRRSRLTGGLRPDTSLPFDRPTTVDPADMVSEASRSFHCLPDELVKEGRRKKERALRTALKVEGERDLRRANRCKKA